MSAYRPEELLIAVIARLLAGMRHVAMGVASPIPGSAALLARDQNGGLPRVSILGSPRHTFWSDGGKELFDCAAQGRIDRLARLQRERLESSHRRRASLQRERLEGRILREELAKEMDSA